MGRRAQPWNGTSFTRMTKSGNLRMGWGRSSKTVGKISGTSTRSKKYW